MGKVSMSSAREPMVRIILPTFNRAHLVTSAIKSVLAQTHENWELIVSNDGSTDGTEAILSEFPKNDSRIKLLNNSNEGVAVARNKAIEVDGTYDYIAFLDDDDQWLPFHLTHSCQFLQEHTNIDIVFSTVETNDLTGNWTERQFTERASRMVRPVQMATSSPRENWYILDNDVWWNALVQDSFFPHTSTVVIRAQAVSRRPWFDTTFEILEDYEFLAYLANRGSAIGFMNYNHVAVQYQGDNLTGGILGLNSPILARRYDSIVRCKKRLLQYANNAKQRKKIQENIGDCLYFLGQCFSEQRKVLSARRCYWESLTYHFSWVTCKSFLLSLLHPIVWEKLRNLRAQ